MNKKLNSNFTSESGDSYYIPEGQRNNDIVQYQAGVDAGDEGTMLDFEEGSTGWIYVDSGE